MLKVGSWNKYSASCGSSLLVQLSTVGSGLDASGGEVLPKSMNWERQDYLGVDKARCS